MVKKSPGINIKNAESLFKISIVFFLISVTLLIVTLSYYHNHPGNTLSATPQKPISINQAISMGLVEMKVSSVRTSDGSQPFIAPKDKQYIIVDLSIKNKSDKPIQVLPSTDTYVKDSQGNIVYLTPYSLANPMRAGQLLPGETIKGETSYLVSKNGTNKLYIDASWSGGVIPFALN